MNKTLTFMKEKKKEKRKNNLSSKITFIYTQFYPEGSGWKYKVPCRCELLIKHILKKIPKNRCPLFLSQKFQS